MLMQTLQIYYDIIKYKKLQPVIKILAQNGFTEISL